MNTTAITADQLDGIIEFDCPFRVTAAGTVETFPSAWAPEVYTSAEDDVQIDSADDWEPLTGYTGQYGYNGACMHSSEYVGGKLARDILSTPGVYVVTSVVDLDAEDGQDDIAGWCVLRLAGE